MSNKEEILKSMRFHQAEYAKFAEQLRAITSEEKLEAEKAYQLGLLAEFKTKYTIYGDAKVIDWEEVEKLITASFGQRLGHSLAYDETGTAGLGLDYGNGGSWSPMFEEENDIRKYKEREEKRRLRKKMLDQQRG